MKRINLPFRMTESGPQKYEISNDVTDTVYCTTNSTYCGYGTVVSQSGHVIEIEIDRFPQKQHHVVLNAEHYINNGTLYFVKKSKTNVVVEAKNVLRDRAKAENKNRDLVDIAKSIENHISEWECFTETEKVHILIIVSNFITSTHWLLNKDNSIWKYEAENNNLLILALLQFLYLYRANNKTDCFLKAHNLLIRYILDCFDNNIGKTQELSALLVRCQDCTNVFLCDGRPWQRIDRIYCPHIKKRCDYYSKLDYSQTKYQKTGNFLDQNLVDVLKNINYVPDLTLLTGEKQVYDFEYVYKVSGWVNRLIDMKSHMKCRCGKHLIINFKYAKDVTAAISCTIFDCPDCNNTSLDKHDKSVYLNYCINEKCHRIIDSRECKRQDDYRYWLCMYCGASKQYPTGGAVCPNCGSLDVYTIDHETIHCNTCGHDGNEYGRKKLMEIKNKEHNDVTEGIDIQNTETEDDEEMPW